MEPDNDKDWTGADVIVVLSYFGMADTLACVESLVAGSPDSRVLVIDNGSFDGVIPEVQRRWPQVDTLQTGTNLGFAGGMNRGISTSLGRGAATVTVLNNDTIVPAGVPQKLAGIARLGAAVSPEVRYADGSERVWFGGGVIDRRTSLARHLSSAEISSSDGEAPLRLSEVLAGCCVTASAETWRRVGLFDERYFLNFEDSDWSVRAKAREVPLVVAREVSIYHRVSASFTGLYSYLGLFYYARNGLLFGSTRGRWDIPTRLRFLRRHVVPVLGRDVRDSAWSEAARHTLIIFSAVLSHASRRYGRAPQILERMAASWVSS